MAATLTSAAVADLSAMDDDAVGDAHIDAFAAFEELAAVVGRPAAHASQQGAWLRALEGELDERGLLR